MLYARSHRAREGRVRVSENDKAQAQSADAEEALEKLQESEKKKALKTPRVKKSGGDDKPKATPSPVHEKKDTINPDAAKPNKTKAELRDDILDKQFGFDRKDKLLKQTGKLSMTQPYAWYRNEEDCNDEDDQGVVGSEQRSLSILCRARKCRSRREALIQNRRDRHRREHPFKLRSSSFGG